VASKKKKAASAKAKKDSIYTAHDKRKFDKYSDPHKACKSLKGSRKWEECLAYAKKFTEDYLSREYPTAKDTTKTDTTKKKK